ncbi:MAG: nucleoside triphosphate pyrophosphohydrolase family protein [Leptolyngbyaceae cyanobacterium RM2_2_4]|nr:nucleoside triphosphate pyrophosphohydrolase family protein [Leptolyngbyaceae cyanobacterium SM1_4_3]NJO48647.1 nucleoside triphosphate pyrophosphohydrolase family protein [Leptolyngbyaceae cyanobacterium RM2_2_4]NJR48211.1 nucleoside triphosphate pyrophosphohydrolase family protein [Leptolyngbyaceae cyanobacterium CSU_1_3]
MDFCEYQEQAIQTGQALQNADGMDIAILGVVGEIGSLSSEYKKLLRDGESHRLFPERIAEELGDILWYLAAFANKFGLDLNTIAEQNLEKCRDRWGWRNAQSRECVAFAFDNGSPEQERLPREFEVEITELDQNGSTKMQAFVNGKQMGNDLTDNSYVSDGYRFHDIFHLSYAAILGWSPVVRQMLGCKRKSHPKIDEVEDGGRAKAIEEGISALVFRYAQDHEFLEGLTELDYELLKTVRNLTSGLEVSQRSLNDWEKAILAGYEVWRQVNQNGGGIVLVDLNACSITYCPSGVKPKSKTAKAISHPTILYSNQKCG